ncbi:MAG: CAP domain-containing protein [Bacteroidota bacterium]
MFKLSVTLFLIVISFDVYCQGSKFDEWNDVKYQNAKPSGSDYMTALENDVIYYTNLARMNPKLFGETYLKKYLDSTKKYDSYSNTLIAELKAMKPLPPFKTDKILYDEAMKHAKDMGKSGKVGHNSSSGTSYLDRVKLLRKTYFGIAENCNYGYSTALDITLGLMIDEGVPDHGHRKNMFHEKLNLLGVSFQPHKTYGNNCVMEFGTKE